MPRLRGFAPVVDRHTEILILGSFPSAASLAAGQYYAHPRNQFWRILSAVLGEPLTELAYDDRLSRLLAHRVGLWDVIAACDRPGSLDADIRNARANDPARLRTRAPRLMRIVCNGGTAGRRVQRLQASGFEVAVGPSTSPAHAGRTIGEKIALWGACLGRLAA